MPKEETIPIPLKYFDVTRSTHTDLDVLQEKRIDDYWNVESGRHLSNSWKGFTKFTFLKEKPPKGYIWSGRRPDHVWPKVRTNIGETAQHREKQEWKNEKPKPGTARRLRRIYFVGPDDEEYNRNHRKNEEKVGKTYGSSHASSQNHLWLYRGIPRIHKATSGTFST